MAQSPSIIDPVYAEALARFSQSFERYKATQPAEPTAMTLATADASGRPAARVVLLKDFDPRGFTFFTNMTSRKGRQLLSNPRAALCFLWLAVETQVNVEGAVEMVSEADADAYWTTRPRDSQIGAWASLQSRPLDARSTLEDRVKDLSRRYDQGPVPRPPHWTGFRVMPERIEFWNMRPFRLHDRTLYEKAASGWTKGLLYP